MLVTHQELLGHNLMLFFFHNQPTSLLIVMSTGQYLFGLDMLLDVIYNQHFNHDASESIEDNILSEFHLLGRWFKQVDLDNTFP